MAQPAKELLDQMDDIAFGQVSPQWIEMEAYEPDPDAAAVILSDIGQATLQWLGNKQVVSYTYHRRIKILTEDGLSAAQFELSYLVDDINITRLEAATYALNPEGEVVSFKVDRRDARSIARSRRQRQIQFEFPLVKVGSVIEYSYTYYSSQLDVLAPWVFQQPYPVLHSEFHLTVPQTHQYQQILQGDLRNMVMLEEPVTFQTRPRLNQYHSNLSARNQIPDTRLSPVEFGTHRTYLLQVIPALVDDAFGPKDQSLLPGLRFQLSGAARGEAVRGVFRNWQQLNRFAMRQLRPGQLRARRSYLQQTAKRVTRGAQGSVAKAEAIFQWVRKTFAWDSTYGRVPTRIERIIKNKRGNGAGLNMLAILLMQQVDVPVSPVLLSTRSHGPVQVVAANLGQFNHIIGSIRVNGTEWLFDVLSELDELGVLPREDLNQTGYLLSDQGGEWVRMQSHSQIVRFTYSRFNLNQSGLLTGDISVTNQSYSAALERNRAGELNQDPQRYLRRTLLTGMDDPVVMDYAVLNLDEAGEPLTISCTLQTRDFVQKVGDLMMVQPMMTKRVDENPFGEDEERTTPIDLTYPLRESHLLGLRIPPGYEMAQLPQPLKVMLPNEAGLFIFNVMEMDNIVHVSSSIFLNQTAFLPSEYQGIRTFFDYIVRKHSEDIVLKRVTTEE